MDDRDLAAIMADIDRRMANNHVTIPAVELDRDLTDDEARRLAAVWRGDRARPAGRAGRGDA